VSSPSPSPSFSTGTGFTVFEQQAGWILNPRLQSVRVARLFNDRLFTGTIVGTLLQRNRMLFMNLHDDGDTETLTWKELEDGKRLFKQSSSKKCPVRFRSALSKLPSTVLGQILNKRFRMTNTDDGTYRCENDTMNGPRSSYWNSKVCTECHDLGRHRQDITNVKIEQFNNCFECQKLNLNQIVFE
jgi:hypothetical protein